MLNWMPSGASPTYLQMHLWVRDQHRPQTVASFGEIGNSRMLRLPHADIIFDTGKTIFKEEVARERERDGFRLIRVGPYYHPDNVLQAYGPYFMTTVHELSLNHPTFAHEGGVRAILDSGGAQIKFGKAGLVDKHHVIEAYNKYADVGLALDIPPRIRLSPRMDVDHFPTALAMLADIQKRNNAYFVDHKRPDLQLINVAHGLTGDDFRRWITTVDDPRNFVGWAISFDSDLDPYCIWRGTAVLLREFGAAENWLHLFAVSGAQTIPIASWLGRLVPNLTSDSSSWIQNSKNRNYLVNQNGKLVGLPVGDKFPGLDEDLLAAFCTCPFCSLMRTFGAHRVTASKKKDPTKEAHFTHPAMVSHNLIMIKETVKFWNERAGTSNLKAYQDAIRMAFPKPKRGTDFGARTLHLLDYLICALVDGPEYADLHVARKKQGRSQISLAA